MSTEENNLNNRPEDDKLLLDHEYDGIKELNNPPPPWLMLIFYGTIIWSVFYVFHYHILGTGLSQDEEYAEAMKEATSDTEANAVEFNEAQIALITDEAQLAKGIEIYGTKACSACHGMAGEGNAVGPNLSDNYWLHGNKAEDVFKAIKYGFPEKGMTPYKDQMSNEDIQILTSYILTKIVGSNPANAKAPQGDLFE